MRCTAVFPEIHTIFGGTSEIQQLVIARAYRGPNNLSDWYLPSKNELNELRLERVRVGGFSGDYYWSSSEFDVDDAWYQHFYSGNQYDSTKYFTGYVRPVRAFG